jgi:hypothetical protein
MVVRRPCKARRADGQPCRAAALTDSEYCLMHDPAHAEAVAEARKLGGMRRRKEVTVRVAYDVEGIEAVPSLQRIATIAILDTLALENGVARNRTLLAGVQVGAKLLETGVLEERVRVLEQAVLHQQPDADSPFDAEPLAPFVGEAAPAPEAEAGVEEENPT